MQNVYHPAPEYAALKVDDNFWQLLPRAEAGIKPPSFWSRLSDYLAANPIILAFVGSALGWVAFFFIAKGLWNLLSRLAAL